MMQSNSVRWVALGDYIEPCDEKNTSRHNYSMLGINKNKEFMPTVANVSAVDISKYKIVKKGLFVFSGMQTGRDICIRIALYEDEKPALISPAYTTFTIKENNILLEYLFMYFNRCEMDRFGWFISDSSVRSNLDWNRFIEIQIPLPSIEVQREMVEAWRGLREMKEENERIAEPLESLCRSYLQDIKYKYPAVVLREYIDEYNAKNTDDKIKEVRGISVTKQFRDTNAKVNKNELKGYKIVPPMHIAYVQTTNNEKVFTFDLNKLGFTIVVSSVNRVIYTTKNNELDIEYLNLWFRLPEFDRFVRYNSWGSAREIFSYEELCRVKIPLPPIEIQKAIVAIYRCADESRKIAAQANALSTAICPALMQKVING